MALNQEVEEYYKLVTELGQRNNAKVDENPLAKEIININDVYKNSTHHANKVCQFLNESTSSVIRGRTDSSAISVGKESAPLIVSLKQMADSIMNMDIKGCDMNIEEKIQDSLSKAEDNCHRLEDLSKSISKSIQNLEFLMKHIKNPNPDHFMKLDQDPEDRDFSTVSELSSFCDKDVVASSPIKEK